jgi:hypothetical protein
VTAAAVLLASYTLWQVDAYPGGLDIWSATWRSGDGKHIRCLIARTAEGLAAKLADADPEVRAMSGGGTS